MPYIHPGKSTCEELFQIASDLDWKIGFKKTKYTLNIFHTLF